MNSQAIIQMLGGIGLFLFAIKLLSESLQSMAGNHLRDIIGKFTTTPILGVCMGTFVTVMLQSSSATTVMTVSFVNAGLMNLSQAIGVIMGANIGTTVTGQIIAFKVKDFAYLFIIVGVLFSLFGRSKFQKYAGTGMLGFGLLFIGMQTMESSMSFLRNREDIFLAFSHNPFLGVLAGTILTLLVQSSSATVGLTLALGTQGLIPLEAGIPIILGDNIGTTITAILASIGADRAAKQACLAHVLFNVIGVILCLILMPLFMKLVLMSADSIGRQLANAHSMFNIFNTIIFLPFVPVFAKLIRKILPEKPKLNQDTVFLDYKLIDASPVIAVNAVKQECMNLGKVCIVLLDQVEEVFFRNNYKIIDDALATEDKVDNLYHSINHFAPDIWQAGIPDDTSRELSDYVSTSIDLERIGDHAVDMLEFFDYRKSRNNDFSAAAMEELLDMYSVAKNSVVLALDSFEHGNTNAAREVLIIASKLKVLEVKLRAGHLQRLDNKECDPEIGIVFADILSVIENIGHHAKSIAKLTIKNNN